MTDEQASSENESDPQVDLDRILSEAEDKGKEIAGIGRDITEAGQFLADLANATRDVIHIVRMPPNMELLISDWSLARDRADSLLGHLEHIDIGAFSSTTGTVASASSDSFHRPTLFLTVPDEDKHRLREALESFDQISERIADAGEVRHLMESLGLNDSAPGRKSPLEQFEIAHAAYEKPVGEENPVVTSLIPMREAIRGCIDHLLRKRPDQEKAKNEWMKIVSIGQQLKRDSLDESIIDSWASQWTHALGTYLSPSKEEDITREEWRQRLVRSTLFLKGFLGGLDFTKFKL